MEVSVSFTDGGEELRAGAADAEETYITDKSVLGRVWIPAEGLILTPPVRIRYERRPWLEGFEFDGIKAAPAQRAGTGTKDAKGFVRSLNTIYSRAYDDYREYGGDDAFDAKGYFRNAAEYFARMAGDEGRIKMLIKFCGFTENMWREGTEEMCRIAMDVIKPVLTGDKDCERLFTDSITEEFRNYIKEMEDG